MKQDHSTLDTKSRTSRKARNADLTLALLRRTEAISKCIARRHETPTQVAPRSVSRVERTSEPVRIEHCTDDEDQEVSHWYEENAAKDNPTALAILGPYGARNIPPGLRRLFHDVYERHRAEGAVPVVACCMPPNGRVGSVLDRLCGSLGVRPLRTKTAARRTRHLLRSLRKRGTRLVVLLDCHHLAHGAGDGAHPFALADWLAEFLDGGVPTVFVGLPVTQGLFDRNPQLTGRVNVSAFGSQGDEPHPALPDISVLAELAIRWLRGHEGQLLAAFQDERSPSSQSTEPSPVL